MATDFPINKGEETILQAAQAGSIADLGSLAEIDREIRPQFLRALLSGRLRPYEVEANGVQIRSAIFKETLALDNVQCAFPLVLSECEFHKQVSLTNASLRALNVTSSHFLDLVDAKSLRIENDLRADKAQFQSGLSLADAEILGNCVLIESSVYAGEDQSRRPEYSLMMARTRVHKGLFMQKMRVQGTLWLDGAQIGSQWLCSGGTFSSVTAQAIVADGIVVGDALSMSDEFSSCGEVRLVRAAIGGFWDCTNGKFNATADAAINAEGIDVKGSVFMTEHCHVKGELRLPNARIGGNWECDGGTFERAEGKAITAQSIRVGGHVFMRNGFRLCGDIDLQSAILQGFWDCSGASFKNPDRRVINADRIDVKGSLLMRDQFHSNGEVTLREASIGGSWICENSSLEHGSGYALVASLINITGDLLMIQIDVKGRVNLEGVAVGRNLLLDDSRFNSNAESAIMADRCKVNGRLSLCGIHCAQGSVSVWAARIGGDWDFRDAHVNGCNGNLIANEAQIAGWVLMDRCKIAGILSVQRAQIGGDWTNGSETTQIGDIPRIVACGVTVFGDVRFQGSERDSVEPQEIDFSDATFHRQLSVQDSKSQFVLKLGGTRIGTLDVSPPAGDQAKSWTFSGMQMSSLSSVNREKVEALLNLYKVAESAQFDPQPYRHLFRVLRDAGYSELATIVIVELHRERARRQIDLASGRAKITLTCFDYVKSSVNYGYSYSRAAYCALGICVLAALVYTGIATWGMHYMAPTAALSMANSAESGSRPYVPGYPGFSGPIYALDHFLPIVDFGQASAWHPRVDPDDGRFNCAGWVLTFLNHFLIASGWVLSTLLVTALSGVMRRVDADQ